MNCVQFSLRVLIPVPLHHLFFVIGNEVSATFYLSFIDKDVDR